MSRPPAPVTRAVHGVTALPVQEAEVGQVTVVVDDAFWMVKVALPALLRCVALPAYSAEAVTVPALTFGVYVTAAVVSS